MLFSDTEEITAKKIMSARTDRSRMRKDDPGHPEDCEVAFKYWKIFGSEAEISTVQCECEKGLRGCADCKRQLGAKVNERFAQIRERRRYYEQHPEEVERIIREGSARARVEAQKILTEVRKLVGMFQQIMKISDINSTFPHKVLRPAKVAFVSR